MLYHELSLNKLSKSDSPEGPARPRAKRTRVWHCSGRSTLFQQFPPPPCYSCLPTIITFFSGHFSHHYYNCSYQGTCFTTSVLIKTLVLPLLLLFSRQQRRRRWPISSPMQRHSEVQSIRLVQRGLPTQVVFPGLQTACLTHWWHQFACSGHHSDYRRLHQ